MRETNRKKRVVVNADDFGFSPGITDGILRAHREGIVTSTTITANMPAAAESVKLLAGAPNLGVGVHLNVSQGPVLSREGAALAGADGVMDSSAMKLFGAILFRPRLLDAVEAECEAQIRWVLDCGIRPTHLDSHRHVHGWGPIFARVARLARRYHIPFVRRLGETLAGSGWPAAQPAQRMVSRMLNLASAARRRTPELWATRGIWGVAHTGRINEAWLVRVVRAIRPGAWEIMTHPASGDDLDPHLTRLIETRRAELAALCSPAVAEAFERYRIELVHYGQLRGQQ